MFLYIAQENLEAAERVHSQLYNSLITISRQPKIGRLRGEIGSGMRSLAVGGYVVYYRLIDGTVRILRVLHGARDQPRGF